MAKVKDLGLNLTPSKLPKKMIVETTKAEEITQKIHSDTEGVILEQKIETPTAVVVPQPVQVIEKSPIVVVENPPVEVEELKKTSFDFPLPLYKAMKRKLVDENTSMRDYVMNLIRKDLGM